MKKTTTKKPKKQAKPNKPQITAAEHFRLRLPTERPTLADADPAGDIIFFTGPGGVGIMSWHADMAGVSLWLPGHLPAHLIPKPEAPEEKMRREFEDIANGLGSYDLARNSIGNYASTRTYEAFEFYKDWQAAREVTP